MTRFYSPAKHFLLALALVICGSTASIAQGVVNNGAKINISSSTFLVIDNGGFTNTNAAGAQVTNAGTIDLDGNWVNNNTTGVFGATPTALTGGTVRLDGGAQSIGGTQETRFFNLQATGTGRKTLTGTGSATGATTYGTVTLTGRSLDLDKHTLTVENSNAATAFSTSGAGYIISETGRADGGYGTVRWKMGNSPAVASYTVPFGSDDASPQAIPFVYNIQAGGAGVAPSPYKTFATYATDEYNGFQGGLGGTDITNYSTGPFVWNNTPYNVEHLTDDYSQASHFFVVDRFWIIDDENTGVGANGIGEAGITGDDPNYTTNPFVQYTFTYDSDELGGSNHITPANLVPQRYNHDADRWGDWLYSQNTFLNATGARQLTMTIGRVPSTSAEDMYPVWTLVDNSDPLPIELVRFAGECGEGSIELKWTTWTETNNDFFTVERSNNGTDFEVVDVIEGAGNSNQSITYNAVDNLPYGGTSYYRLKNTDFNGKSEYSEIIAVTCGNDGNDFNFVNAYDVDHTDIVVEFTASDNEDYTIFLYDAAGRRVLDHSGVGLDGMNKVRLNSGGLAHGIYIINLSNNVKNFSKRVLLQ